MIKRNILFVGERCNIKISNIPFDKRYNSGKFLYKSLQNLPHWIYESCHFEFDNVYKGNRINRQLERKQYSVDRVIALGDKSFRLLFKMNISCVYVPHPSFYKRFKSKRGYKGYSKLISEAIINGN